MVTSLEPGVISSTSPSVSFAVVMVAYAAYNIGPTIVQVPDSRGHAQCPWQPGRRGPRQTSIGYAQMPRRVLSQLAGYHFGRMNLRSSGTERALAAGGDSTESAHANIRAGLIAASAAVFAAATAVAAYIGYLRMFTGFASYDDEGAMLVSLRSFISGHALYDQVVLQYGPFYFEFFGLLGAFGVSFDNNSGRLTTLAVWLAMALLAGVAVFAFTRNLALGLTTYLITFATAALTSEPMHPAGLVCLLVIGIASVALISAGRWSGPWPFLVMGALTAAAILTKINVGGFAAISIAFACVLTFPTLAPNRAIRLVAAAGFVAVPFLLMRAYLDLAYAQRYAFHVGFCALALVVATSTSHSDPKRRLSELGWLFAGGAALAVLVLAVALFRGSSPSDLLHGIILYPIDQPQAYTAILQLPSDTLAWDAVGLGGALLWTLYRLLARRPEVAIEGGVRVLVGLVIWLTLIGGIHIPGLLQLSSLNHPLALPLALAWVVAAPRGRPEGFERLDFARALVPALAILQSLHAFPVAGSQATWAALALVSVGAVSIGDGLTQLGLTRARFQLATSLVFLTFAVSWLPPSWHQSRAAYAASVPLGLPGASLIHVPAAQAALLRQVTQSIRDNCDTFISIPGLDSFYIFAQLQPPSPLPTRFMWLIDDVPHQQALIEASQRINRLCVVENDHLITFWNRGRQVNGPLVTYIQAGFVPAYSFGDYSILKPAS